MQDKGRTWRIPQPFSHTSRGGLCVKACKGQWQNLRHEEALL
jgi:hypothetical protein